MREWLVTVWSVVSLTAAVPSIVAAADTVRLPLASGWAIQSSAAVPAKGGAISRAGFSTGGWHAASVPGTVVGALVEAGRLPDPYVGTNLRSFPGTTYPIGAQFANLPMPADSPYKPSWWYRKEFELPSPANRHWWLNFNGINFRANIWVNGVRVATKDQVAGTFRRYEFNITPMVRRGAMNAVAV